MMFDICRIHHREAVWAEIDGQQQLVCPLCAIEGLDPAIALSPPPTPSRSNGRDPTVPEEALQAAIVRALRGAGYLVLQTSRHRKRCVHCGRYSAGGDGADKGVPDLLVRHPDWPVWTWIGLEVKTPRGVLSNEQAELVRVGAVRVVRSVEDALNALESVNLIGGSDPYEKGVEG